MNLFLMCRHDTIFPLFCNKKGRKKVFRCILIGMKNTTIVFVVAVVLLGLGLFVGQKEKTGDRAILSFDSCASEGGTITTPDYNGPRNCTVDNKLFAEDCISNEKYFVISKQAEDYAGSDILVKYKSSPAEEIACDYSKGESDFEILNNQGAQYILALENDFLILDSGTGPDPRGLIVYDVKKQKKIFTDGYSQPVTIKDNSISYWAESSIKATESNCASFLENQGHGNPSAIDKRITLNLLTLTTKDLGEQRCSSRQ